MKQKTILTLVGAVALATGVAIAWVVAKQAGSAEPQYFQYFPQPRKLADVELVDQTGQAVTNQDVFKDRWSLLFVGYTFCPDVCPTTMAALSKIYPDLKSISTNEPIQVVFISVDPNRDTPERLASYVEYFNSEFVALTGEHKQLFPLTRSLGLMYAIAESTDNPNYLVDHSASVVVIDPDGFAIGRFKPKFNPGEVAVSDSEQILTDMPDVIKNH
ncbi:MAG: SCO family protein [Alteromonadaceae bacterium]|nr:SCO family protein [Alteromonadaceae bacterium]